MSFPSSKFRVFLMVTALLVGLTSSSCSSYLIKNLTSQPVRVILQTADGTQADIVNAGDTWATWSTDDSAYSVTVKNAKLYMDQFDKLNGEFEAIKNQPGLSAAERETKIKDFVQNVTERFQQVETIGQCATVTCPFCIGMVTIESDNVTCAVDDDFAERLKSEDFAP